MSDEMFNHEPDQERINKERLDAAVDHWLDSKNNHDFYSDYLRYHTKKNDLDILLVRAIITHESNWDTYAMRYEAHYQWLYKEIECAKKMRCRLDLEIFSQKTSWGLGQMMGAVARELGHEGSMAQLTDGFINMKYVCMHLKNIKQRFKDQDSIIAVYNGGPNAVYKKEGIYPNQGYVDSVNKIYESLLQKK